MTDPSSLSRPAPASNAELLRLAGKRREVGQALELLEGIFESSRWNG